MALSNEQREALKVATFLSNRIWKREGEQRDEIAAALLEARADGIKQSTLSVYLREVETARLRREAQQLRDPKEEREQRD